MGCCGGNSVNVKPSHLICAQLKDGQYTPGSWIRIIGAVTNIVYGYRFEGKKIKLHQDDFDTSIYESVDNCA